jgi:hypothetical protein
LPAGEVELGQHQQMARRLRAEASEGRDEDWGQVMVVIDPFHNRLVFHQALPDAD